MDDGSQIAGFVIFLVLFFMNFLLYAFSAAISAMNYNLVSDRLEEGDQRAEMIAGIHDTPRRLINTIRVNMTALILVCGRFWLLVYPRRIAAPLGSELSQGLTYIISYFVTCLVIGAIVISLDMIVPKRLGAKYASIWAFSLCKVTGWIMGLWTPAVWIFTRLADLILRIFGIRPDDEFENVSEEEIMSMLNEGHEQGVIESSEAQMIANIFEFGDKEAQDIMTHRKSIVALNGDMNLKEAVDFMLSENNSRFPVYLDSIDNIIGIVHLKDAMIRYGRHEVDDWRIKDIQGFLRKAEFIPETRNIDVLFRDMQSNKTHIVIVIDEYGQTSGIITMEDVLEEIVGNILDEYDEEEQNILSHKDNVYVVKGLTPIDELSEVLGVEFEKDDFDTLNGFLISQLDRIPKDDERPQITVEGISYKVLNVKNKMISLVKITVPKKPKNKEEKEEN